MSANDYEQDLFDFSRGSGDCTGTYVQLGDTFI